MKIIPAIDLRGGQVVRLLQGEYDQETVYQHSPVEIAQTWQEGGAALIHLVDLDGAREGAMLNRQAIQAITQSVSVETELGGGLRTLESVKTILDELGVGRAILGSILLEDPSLAKQAAERYPHRIVLGIDARDGHVATRGWRETSTVKALDLVQEFAGLPFADVIYTDISRDGTLAGPNLDALGSMAQTSPFPVIASGGIGNLDDIRAIAKVNQQVGGKISGIIVGKALYENQFTLPEAIAALQ